MMGGMVGSWLSSRWMFGGCGCEDRTANVFRLAMSAADKGGVLVVGVVLLLLVEARCEATAATGFGLTPNPAPPDFRVLWLDLLLLLLRFAMPRVVVVVVVVVTETKGRGCWGITPTINAAVGPSRRRRSPNKAGHLAIILLL